MGELKDSFEPTTASSAEPESSPEPTAAPSAEPEGSPEPTAAPSAEPVRADNPPDDEYERAVWYGFLPETLIGADPDSTVPTWAQYCEMLGRMIKLHDESLCSTWEEMTENAPDVGMKRDGAMVSLLFAAETMGYDTFTAESPEELGAYAVRVWDNVTMDYPVFDWDTPVDLGEGCSDSNHVGPAYDFCIRRVSVKSGKSLLEFDRNGDFRLEQPLTLREAMLSAVRLYESEPPTPVYISVYDVGTYDKTIITDALLSAPSDLPEPTHSALPTTWKGAGMSARKDGMHPCMNFQKADVQFLADNGFNFTRVFLGFSALRFPDYPEDVTLVNELELLDLDQLIAWGIEYGVHIQLSLFTTPNGGQSLDIGADEWENIRAYWEALARRYVGIPSRYLTFDLINEIEPREEGSFETAVSMMERIVSDLRTVDPDRVLLISFSGGDLHLDWIENMAKLGLSLGCHPYLPPYLASGDDIYLYEAAPARWPYPYCPGNFMRGDTLEISGELGGKSLLLDFWCYNGDFQICFDDGAEQTIGIADPYYEDGRGWRFDTPYTIDIPSEVTSVKIWSDDAPIMLTELGISDGLSIDWLAICFTPRFNDPEAVELKWNGSDGWTSEVNLTPELTLENFIRPQMEIAEQNGVGFMVNEFGIYACNMGGWSIDIVTDYTGDTLQMLENAGIPWCLCEAEGWPYRYLTVPDGEPYEWANATLETVTCSGRTFQYCVELLDVFRKYTMG